MRKKAFTLIELLVVIAIIALLLSILLPSLRKVKEMARTLVCQTRIKQLITAWHTYAVDYNDTMVVAYPCDADNVSGGEWTWTPTEVGTDNPVKGREPTLEERQEGVKRGALFSYTPDEETYHCPSDRSEREHFRSYSVADCMNGINQYLVGSYKRWDCLTKVSQVRSPSSKYVFVEENDPRAPSNLGAWEPDFDLSQNAFGAGCDPLGIWHLGRSVFGFADGHCEQRKWSKEVADYFYTERTGYELFRLETERAIEDLEWIVRGWAKP
jgi:prepilin-type N-terminal cleavage/methylation domain-containing protein/prepilin-type processing-associated H-X9-DG protein